MTNRLAATLPEESRQRTLELIEEIRTELRFLIDLSPEERRSLPKFNDDQGFVRRAYEVALQNPDILRRSFDVEAFGEDLRLSDDLDPIRIAVNRLAELIGDTHMLARSEAYVAALKVLDAVEDAGRGAGLDEVKGELQRRFGRRRRR